MNKKDSWLFWWTLYLAVSSSYLRLDYSLYAYHLNLFPVHLKL